MRIKRAIITTAAILTLGGAAAALPAVAPATAAPHSHHVVADGNLYYHG